MCNACARPRIAAAAASIALKSNNGNNHHPPPLLTNSAPLPPTPKSPAAVTSSTTESSVLQQMGSHAAVSIGDDDSEFAAVLKNEPSLFKWRDLKGNSLLHIAARRNSLFAARLLLESADHTLINAINASQQSALHESATKGHFDMTRFLLEKGINASHKSSEGETAIDAARKASQQNGSVMIEFLL